MANIIIKPKVKPGEIEHGERFPESHRIMEKWRDRRVQGKPIDGNCFKDMGRAIEEADKRRRRQEGYGQTEKS